MKDFIWLLLAIAVAVFGYERYQAIHGPDPGNPLMGTWVVDLDRTASMFASSGASPEEVVTFRRQFDGIHAHIEFEKDTVAIVLPGSGGYPFAYDLQPSAASCYRVVNRETRKFVTLCIHGDSMQLQREGPGLIFKRQ